MNFSFFIDFSFRMERIELPTEILNIVRGYAICVNCMPMAEPCLDCRKAKKKERANKILEDVGKGIGTFLTGQTANTYHVGNISPIIFLFYYLNGKDIETYNIFSRSHTIYISGEPTIRLDISTNCFDSADRYGERSRSLWMLTISRFDS